MTPLNNANVTPLGIASIALNGVFIPLIGWLVKSGRKIAKKSSVQGVKVASLETQVTKLQITSDAAEPRIARLESAICNIEKSAEDSKQQHAAVMSKLDQLPRLAALLEAYSSAIAAIVPRSEVDSRVRGVEDRLRLVESDLRKGPGDARRV